MTYDKDYYEGDSSNYGCYGGYRGKFLGFARFIINGKAMRLIKKYKKNGRLLELGCAYGYFINKAKNNGFDATGCDISQFAIDEGKKMFPDIDISQSDISKLKFKDKTFDIVATFETLEHCKNLEDVLEEMNRVIKDDGLLLVSIPDTQVLPVEKDVDPTHIWHLSLEEWVKRISKSGFKLIKSLTYPPLMIKIKPIGCTRFILFEKT